MATLIRSRSPCLKNNNKKQKNKKLKAEKLTQTGLSKFLTPCKNLSKMEKQLSKEQKDALINQDSRKCDSFRAEKFQKESKKHWDLFYKRNETRFFKDRHWTTRGT